MGKENFLSDNDKVLKDLFKDLDTEHPSDDFTLRVMNLVEAKPNPVFEHKPVISGKGWFVIAAVMLILVFATSVNETSFDYSRYIPHGFSIPAFQLPAFIASPVFISSLIACISLVFFELMIMKRRRV